MVFSSLRTLFFTAATAIRNPDNYRYLKLNMDTAKRADYGPTGGANTNDVSLFLDESEENRDHSLNFANVLKGEAASPLTVFERKAALINM